MKTNMNPDLEFLRGLRERLKLRASLFRDHANDSRKWSRNVELAAFSSVSSESEKMAIEISEYLKTRGIE